MKAQTTIAIGSGTTTNTNTSYPAPYGNYYWGAKHQILIKASELTSAGMSAGTISKLIFDVAVPKGTPLTGFTIKMASTTLTAITTTFVNTGFSTVFGPQSYTDVSGWNTHTFSSPFYWDGTSNIIVETCFNNSTYTSNAQMYYSTTSFNSVGYKYQDINGICATATANAVSMQRPNIRFTWTPSTNPPTINFSANKTFSCNGLINFTDSSCCNVNSRIWDFGDGTTSTLQNPSHTYTSSGVFAVSLIATNSYGSDTLVKNNYLTISLGGGPVVPSCTSQTSAYCCGFGITNVTFNTINNTTANAADGYKNYCCLYGTNVYAGSSYSISVSTPQPSPHNVKVWIDYNNNGIFDPVTELAFSSASTTIATGSISIPITAVLDTALRMRVSADFDGNAIPTPCGTLQYGQAEDYSVTIIANTNPPVANFVAQPTISCDGIVAFTDNSTNTPTTWLWNFGDGTTSNVNNPTHTYLAGGTYTVILSASNTFGSNAIVKNNYITITLGNTPIAANCAPPTVSYCCGYGIYKVTLNTINNTTANGVDGYKDYSCPQQTTLIQDSAYSIFVQTGPTYAQDTRVWIDLNNNGIFETTELKFSSSNTFNPAGAITIPAGTVLNTPLRMRVFSDNAGSNPSPCSNATKGQAEDYTIIVIPDTSAPIAKFAANVTSSCSGSIVFADSSLKTPTSWLWDFGDGTSSSLQNPSHQYTTIGTFTVTLIATNTYGSDTLIKTNYINITSLSGSPITTTCTQNTTNYCCGMGIYNLTFNTINNTTYDGIDGYKDYSCSQQTTVTSGQTYSISIQTGTGYTENVKVWIDYNNDGTFNSANEQVFVDNAFQNHNGNVIIPGNAVLNTPLRLRVASNYDPIYLCSNLQYGQAEDYSVTIINNLQPPVANFIANYTTINPGGTVTFTDLSNNIPTSWQWTFSGGSPTSSATQNPSVVYNTLGVYPVNLLVTNSYGADSLTKTAYINVVNSFNMCSGTTSTAASSGALFDSGGASANYSSSENCNFLISPACASSVTLNFSTFNTESGYDYLNVYNGTSTSAPLLLSADGSSIPASVTANSGSMFITFTSDVSVEYPGFEANWTSVTSSSTTAPIAYFGKIQNNCQNFQFTDSSLNCPSSWQWDFGDGATSISQNPFHTYANTGTYNVTLIVCNGYGCDTLIKTNYIVITTPLVAASCSPNTIEYCCGVGIYNVTFNAINKTSADGIDGYKDYSCAQQTQVLPGQSYAVSVTTDNAYSNHVKIWIDYNNDGVFNTTNEQVFADSAITYHNGTIIIPGTPTLNTALRMRVAADFNDVYACTDVAYGQMEDYSVLIQGQIGINDPGNNNNNLIVYPNPTNQFININYSFYGFQEFTIYLYNILGEKIYIEKQTGVSTYKKALETTNYPAGVYRLLIESKNERISRQINIIH